MSIVWDVLYKQKHKMCDVNSTQCELVVAIFAWRHQAQITEIWNKRSLIVTKIVIIAQPFMFLHPGGEDMISVGGWEIILCLLTPTKHFFVPGVAKRDMAAASCYSCIHWFTLYDRFSFFIIETPGGSRSLWGRLPNLYGMGPVYVGMVRT